MDPGTRARVAYLIGRQRDRVLQLRDPVAAAGKVQGQRERAGPGNHLGVAGGLAGRASERALRLPRRRPSHRSGSHHPGVETGVGATARVNWRLRSKVYLETAGNFGVVGGNTPKSDIPGNVDGPEGPSQTVRKDLLESQAQKVSQDCVPVPVR